MRSGNQFWLRWVEFTQLKCIENTPNLHKEQKEKELNQLFIQYIDPLLLLSISYTLLTFWLTAYSIRRPTTEWGNSIEYQFPYSLMNKFYMVVYIEFRRSDTFNTPIPTYRSPTYRCDTSSYIFSTANVMFRNRLNKLWKNAGNYFI